MTPTDADAIRRSLAEPAAFGAVFDRHFAAVHAFAQRRVGAELAEEVAAEAFARAFAARRRYDAAHADALPWLLGIATNLMRRHWRTEKRRLAAYARAAVATRRPPTGDRREAIAAVARLPRRQRESCCCTSGPTSATSRSPARWTSPSAPSARASTAPAARSAPTPPWSPPVPDLELLRGSPRPSSRPAGGRPPPRRSRKRSRPVIAAPLAVGAVTLGPPADPARRRPDFRGRAAAPPRPRPRLLVDGGTSCVDQGRPGTGEMTFAHDGRTLEIRWTPEDRQRQKGARSIAWPRRRSSAPRGDRHPLRRQQRLHGVWPRCRRPT